MKVIDTAQYVSAFRDLTEAGKEVSMRIAGNSMSPFLIHERDFISFREPDRKLKKGDMVFFQRDNGQFVMHRIWKIKPEGYYIVGDAQQDIEGPVQEAQIFALITKVQRKGRWIGPGDFWWDFFEKIWIRMVPFRRVIVGSYTLIRGKRK